MGHPESVVDGGALIEFEQHVWFSLSLLDLYVYWRSQHAIRGGISTDEPLLPQGHAVSKGEVV